METTAKHSSEIRERAARLVFDHQAGHESQWAAIYSIAGKIGCTAETLRRWVRRSATRPWRAYWIGSAETE